MEDEGQQVSTSGTSEPQRPVRGHRYRSLYWPLIVLAAGVIALLSSQGVISSASLVMLFYVWPLILIGGAVDLIVGRRSALAGTLVGVATAAVIVILMAIGPAVGWSGDTELQTQEVDVPVGGATSAEITIGTGAYPADIHALTVPSSPEAYAARSLVAGEVTFRGNLQVDEGGPDPKTVNVQVREDHWWWPWLNLSEADTWDLGLDPELPIDLTVSSSSGAVELDLSDIELSGFEASTSSGDMKMTLPSGEGDGYPAAVRASSGDVDVQVAEAAHLDLSVDMSSGDVSVVLGDGSDVTLTFNGSSGRFTLVLAPGQAMRVEVRSISSGDVGLPSGLVQISGETGKEGVWETPGYASAAHQVLVVIESMSSGDVRIDRAD